MRINSALNRYQSFNANRTVADKMKSSTSGMRMAVRKNGVSSKPAGMKKVPADLQFILSREEKIMLNKLFPNKSAPAPISLSRHFSQFGNQIDMRI